MNFLPHVMAALAGAVLLQAAPCQAGVSIVVKTTNGLVGAACEPFDCQPHFVVATPNETVGVDIYGRPNGLYALLVGWPSVECLGFPGVFGGLVISDPVLTLEIGLIPDTGVSYGCDVDVAATAYPVPGNCPVGADLILQAVAFSPTDLDIAFTRGVDLIIK